MCLSHPALDGADRAQRLHRDRALLARDYPQLRFTIDDTTREAFAAGPLVIPLPDGTPVDVEVRIEFGPLYPTRAPRAYDAGNRWTPESDRHIEPDGHLCLFLRAVDEPDMSEDDALLAFLTDLEQFLRQQLILDSQRRFNPTARFPGPEWPHGDAAYRLFAVRLLEQEPEDVREALWAAAQTAPARNAPCPCGSGRPHESCHRNVCKRLRRAAREAHFRNLTYDELVQITQEFR